MIRDTAPATGFTNLRGSRGLHRVVIAFGVLCAFLVMIAALPVSRSLAGEHVVISGEYGKEGPVSSGVGEGCHLAYDSATQHLFLSSDGKIYGLSVTPGSATPLGGGFPITAGIGTGCGDPDIEVDNSGNGNIYGVQSGGQIYGWNSSGSTLGAPWPVSVGGEKPAASM